MKFVIQRVNKAKVEVAGETIGSINKGFLVLIGISAEDSETVADKMIKKMLGLRIFSDDEGKINKSLADCGGELLLVSQFTLYADCKKGNRPSFTNAAPVQMAESLYEYIVAKCRETEYPVSTGAFGADMEVSLVNKGPFTIILDSREL